MIAIIDYGSGNVSAISTILEKQKIPHVLTSNQDTLAQASKYILPGVGAFDPSIKTLRETGMVDLLTTEIIDHKKPVLGICVGMHLLADSSEEGQEPGLGWIPGRVKKIVISEQTAPPHLPHMGWNSISIRQENQIFKNVNTETGFYFLHSYYFDAKSENDVVASVEYRGSLTCSIVRNNIYGMQFHPEKSHDNGKLLFKNFASL